MGQYGGIIGGVVGAVVGFFAGGNVYAGWMIGSAIGGAYSASQQVIPGPKIGDIATQTSQEGVPRPIVFGRSHPIAGNVICDGGPRVVKRRESQGKGGPKVETESAYRTYAVGFCEGPVSAFLKVWKNNQLVYDATSQDMMAENTEFLRYARFFYGNYTQMPSPDLEAIKGAGNVPAHRGTAYIVFKDEDVTDQRGMWSQWKAVISTTATAGNPEDIVSLDSFPTDIGSVNDGPILYLNGSDPEAVIAYPSSPSQWQFSTGEVAKIKRYLDGSTYDYPNLSGRPEDPLQILAKQDEWVLAQGQSFGLLVLMKNGVEQTSLIPYSGASEAWHYASAGSGNYGGDAFFYGASVYLAVSSFNSGQYNSIYRWPLVITPELSPFTPTAVAEGIGSPETGYYFVIHVSKEGKVRSINGEGEYKRFGANLQFEAFEKIPDEVPLGGNWRVRGFGVDEYSDIGIYYSSDGGSSILQVFRHSESLLIAEYTLPVLPYENRFVKFMFADDAIYFQIRNQFYYIVVTYQDATLLLSDVVSEICDRAGLYQYDVNSLIEPIRGFTITNQYPASGALQSLSQVFFFDPSNQNGEIRFVKRGADASKVISQEDMIDYGDEFRIEETRRDTLAVPRVLHLNYYDIEGGLNTDKQFSERPDGTRAIGEQSLQTSVILSADEAATVVSINHGAMAEVQKGEVNFSLGDNYLSLTESDPIIVQYDGKAIRGVVAQVEIDDGEQKYKVVRDRQSLYTLRVQGIPAAPVPLPPSSIIGPTLIDVMDIPILRDMDDQLGFYLAISGSTPAWQGAFVEVSRDGGQNYEEGQRVTASTQIGYTQTSLGDHPQEYPDSVNSVRVRFSTPDSLIGDSNLAGMMNRRNLALVGGGEIINFSQVDEVEEGIWDVSGFLRGRKGTETQQHPAMSRFVILDGAIFVPADLTALNRTLTFRATSFGRPLEESSITTLVFTGQSQRERQPAYLTAYRNGSNIVANWQGVGRLGGGVNVAMGAYFATYRVSATDGVATTTQDVTTITASIDASIFTGPVTVSVSQVNSLTGSGPSIEVFVQ